VNEVVFVGTSDAFGAGGRRQSAIVVRGSAGTLLMDCGSTTGSGLDALAIERDEIDAILVSHFHGDHFGGIPLILLAALYEDQRRHPLRIAGPPGTERRVRELASAMGHPLDGRAFGFRLEFEEIAPGRNFELGPLRVEAFATHHSPDSYPHGFLLETGSARIAYSGDTGWFSGLPDRVAGADLFICECTYRELGYHYHLNLATLESHREEFDCGRIVLTHLGAQMADRDCASFETADDGTVVRV
jgi:ribonuclease BN (tRNA processing enzyme)